MPRSSTISRRQRPVTWMTSQYKIVSLFCPFGSFCQLQQQAKQAKKYQSCWSEPEAVSCSFMKSNAEKVMVNTCRNSLAAALAKTTDEAASLYKHHWHTSCPATSCRSKLWMPLAVLALVAMSSSSRSHRDAETGCVLGVSRTAMAGRSAATPSDLSSCR